MTLNPPNPSLHGGVGGRRGQAEQSATHLYLRLSVTFRGGMVGGREGRGQGCDAKLKWGGAKKCGAKSRGGKKRRPAAKWKNLEAENRPQSETHRVISIPNCSTKKKEPFSSLAFLLKRADSTTAALRAAANKLDSWCISWNRHTPGSAL